MRQGSSARSAGAGRAEAPRYRLLTVQAALALWALAVLTRLFWLQVMDHAWLEHRARLQQQHTVDVLPHRGTIYDRNLTPLAMSLPVVSLYANPHQVTRPNREAAQLAPILGLGAAALARSLSERRGFVWVARQIPANQAKAAEALHLPGIFAQPTTRRFYPKGELAASVLGFVGLDGNGLGGLEREYNAELRGQSGKAVMEVDARGDAYSQIERPPVEGENLVLTIDQNIQYIAQQELDKAVKATRARDGIAIVENPRTGEILALADSPSFNPDDFAHTPASRLGDPAVSSPYEPGSVFKLVTLSAALEQHLITPEELINCQEGSIVVGGRLIHDHARFGIISVTDILKHSSDVGAIKIGEKLGDAEFYHYIRAYGFGRRTGIGLPGESAGILWPLHDWLPMSIGAVSMGQEVAVTPVQVIAMASSLANGGVYHAPRIVLDTFRGRPPEAAPVFTPAPGRRIVSAFVANEMKQMMAQVVLGGTGRWAQLDGYTAGGKTGTAQKVDPGTHRYSQRDYVASFVGFAPINDPAMVCLVVLDSPRGGHEGGQVAGPVFKAIAERVLPYLGVPHDVPLQTQPAPIRIAASDAVEESQPIGPPAAPAAPLALAPPATGAEVVVSTGAPAGIALPDFYGQPVRTVTAICQRLGLALTLQGSGVAQSQSPAAGARLRRGATVTVRFGQ
jgi:cell division protein FtsI/penicillin-binding protein 2